MNVRLQEEIKIVENSETKASPTDPLLTATVSRKLGTQEAEDE
jgi:hypothetical protein